MQLAEISIRRPVFATVLSLLVLLVGLMSYSRLTVREYPKIDEPVVSVSTRYQGASADVIESQITKVLEDQLAVMDGTAATLCRDNKLPILVFDLADPDNIAKAVQGENVGTLVYEG